MPYIESGSVLASPNSGQKASTAKDSIMQNVNLYRGAVAQNIMLASLDGLDDLNVSVSANYAPDDETFSESNRFLRNGVLGTGMSLPLLAIFTKNRTAKESYQADYYFSGAGGEFPLYRTGKKVERKTLSTIDFESADGGHGYKNDYVEFTSVEHPFFIFKKYEDKWEVIKEDGAVWIFGGQDDSLEINVGWGNFTGPLNSPGGKEFPVGWYLSKIISRFGNTVAFTYENIKYPLGGVRYTSEIHLKTVRSTFGETIKLNYLKKQPNEYTLEHNALNGGHQFLCETHYLDSLDVHTADGTLKYSQKLTYQLLPAAKNEVKRLLTSVNQVAKDGEVLPGLRLKWNVNNDFAGHLSRVSYPREAVLEFAYQKAEVLGYQAETFVDCQTDWKKTIMNGADFTASLFYKDNAARLRILSWDVSWQIFEDEPMNKRGVRNATLFTGNGIVVLRYLASDGNYTLRILKRVPVRRYDWEAFDFNLGSAGCPSIACGKDFVAVQYPNKNGIKIYQFNYLDNKWNEFELPIDAMGHQVIGAGNGCVFAAYGHDNSQSVRLVTFFCDESRKWRIGDAVNVSAQVTWDYAESLPVWSINGSLASACFIADKDTYVEATMIAVSWDANFKIIKSEILKASQPKTSVNPLYSVTTNTMIGFADTALRYTPAGFIRHSLFNAAENCEYAYAYAGDLFLGVEKLPNGTQRFRAARFDAASSRWTVDSVPFSENLSNLNAICRPLAIANYAFLGRSVFLRDTDEKWKITGNLPDGADLNAVRLDPAGNYLLYGILNASLARFVPLSPLGFGNHIDIPGGKISDGNYYEAGSSAFFLACQNGQASGFIFCNLHRNNFLTQSPKLTLLKSVTLDSGLDRQSVYLDYDMDGKNGTRIENGSFAAGSASVLPAAKDGSFGKTVYSYFNGSAPARFKYEKPDQFQNCADFYTHFAGQVFKTVSYDGEKQKLTENCRFMRAFDTQGFLICQTKITNSDFLKRFSLKDKASSLTDEIKSAVEYEYEPKYFRRRKIINKSFDKNGREAVSSQTFRYAFEDYPEMLKANILNDVSLMTGKNETKNVITKALKYEYKKNAAGFYYQASESQQGRAEGEWLPLTVVTETDKNGKTLCEQDERGIPTATLYDKSGLYPIAITKNALSDEVLYCGFEPYEETGRLSIDGKNINSFITNDECFSGTKALKLEKGKMLALKMKIRDGGLRLRVSLKSKGNIVVAVDFGSGGAVKKTYEAQNGWHTEISSFHGSKAVSSAIITIVSPADDAYLDALYLTPLEAKGEASVYTGSLMLQSASHSSYASGTRAYFDRYDSPLLTASDDGNFMSLSNTIYHAGGIVNEMYTLKPSSEGVFQDLRYGYDENPFFAPTKGGFTFTESDNFALIFLAPKNKPSLSFGKTSLTVTDGDWILNNGTEKQTAKVPKGAFYALIKMGERCRFYGDGVILFTFTHKGPITPPKLMDTSDVNCIGYVPHPNILLSCCDYSGRPIQDQSVTEDSLNVVHTIYNELGVQAARTTQVRIASAFWGYRKDFVKTYNLDTGETSGEINSLFPEASNYPCTSYQTTLCSKPEIKEVASPGRDFRFGSELTVKHSSCSLGGFPEFTKDGFCSGNTITDPDGMITINLTDGNNGKVMSGRVSYDRTICEITAYEFDAYGNTTKVFYPNYFAKNADAEKFISTIEYDSLNNITARKDPNTDKVLSVYDCFGNLRFMKQGEQSGHYLYNLYDKYGRMTETGKVNGLWDDNELRAKADKENERPQGGIPVRQMVYDELGQLKELITTTNGKAVIENHEYDKYGRQIKYRLTAAGRTEECLTEYDTAGNVIKRRTGNPKDGVLSYSYDVNGLLRRIYYNGALIYSLGFSPHGNQLAYEMLGNSRRDYSYNSANYLTGISGSFFSQKISYLDDGAKKSGQISSVATQFEFEGDGFKKKSSFTAKYDALGRMIKVTSDNLEPITYAYDANGNHKRSGVSYQAGTDKLILLDGTNISYEGFGAVKSVAGRYEFDYEPITQAALSIKYGESKINYVIGSEILGFDSGEGLVLEVSSEDGKSFFERRADGKGVMLVHGANGIFAQIVDGKVFYLIKDYRSSVCGIAAQDTLLAAYSYDSFGNITEKWENAGLPAGLVPFRFAGARYEKTGLYRFKMRFYDPLTGRFISIDPETQYANPYLYGTCDWINYFDPDGAFNIGGFFASLFAGIALIAIGAAVTVMTAGVGGVGGFLLATTGAGLIGAGIASTVYSITSAINDDFSWGAWAIHMGSGFVTGAVFAGIGALMPTMGVAGSIASDMICGVLIGAGESVVTNGLLNINNGQAFFDNVVTNVVTGAIVGGVFGVFTGVCTGVRNAKSMVRRGGANVRQIGYHNAPGGSGGLGMHSKIGVRLGNAGDSVASGHITGTRRMVNGQSLKGTTVRTGIVRGNSANVKWVNVKNNVATRVQVSVNPNHPAPSPVNRLISTGRVPYNKVFNNCTGYVIRVSADAGIYQPLWARTPATLNIWAWLTTLLQS
ncbi:MAG: hypothetical protein FWG91_07345 [Lachnospiraceae bacterium]|nr:hypothetical protein [Lachnospiraceae bacterium]